MMHAPVHPLDPNFLVMGHEREHHIIAEHKGEEFWARVDAEDYWHFSRWRWFIKFDKQGKKPYVFRPLTIGQRPNRTTRSIWLHVAIHERAVTVRPDGHTMVDHINSDTLECRKFNIRYATPSMNARNVRK